MQKSSSYTPYPNYEVSTRNQTTHYITLHNEVVATYSYNTDNPSIYNIQYIVNNELNTPVLYTDTEGKVSRTHHTDTSGNIIHNSTRADVHHSKESFATYQTLPASGLLYAQARLYDPVTSLFLQPDPLESSVPSVYISDPEQQNSYSYARNNPVTYTDPSGEIVQVIVAVLIVGIISANVYPAYLAYTDAPAEQLEAAIGLQHSIDGIVGSMPINGGGVYAGFANPSNGVVKNAPKNAKIQTQSVREQLAKYEIRDAEKGLGHVAKKHVGLSDKELVARTNQGTPVKQASTYNNNSEAATVIEIGMKDPRYKAEIQRMRNNPKVKSNGFDIQSPEPLGRSYNSVTNTFTQGSQTHRVVPRIDDQGNGYILTAFPK